MKCRFCGEVAGYHKSYCKRPDGPNGNILDTPKLTPGPAITFNENGFMQIDWKRLDQARREWARMERQRQLVLSAKGVFDG